MSITKVSRVSADLAESIVALVNSQRIQVRLHTGDPGAAGTSNAATEVDPAVVNAADWAAFAEHTPTAAYGGREAATGEIIDFGTATGTETAAWISLWHEGDPNGAPGTYDIWIANAELQNPREYHENDTVRFPLGMLKLFGSGSYVQDSE